MSTIASSVAAKSPAAAAPVASIQELTNSQRIMSASAGALLTSLSVTPFDVIKIRLQSQRPITAGSLPPVTPLPSTPTQIMMNGSGQTGAIGALRKGGIPRAVLVDCTHYHLHTGLTDVWCRKCDMTPPPKPTVRGNGAAALRFTGSLDAAVKIVQHEGVLSLWRGLAPTLVLSIPSTVVYFNLYDQFKRECERLDVPYPPLAAGTTARALTTTLVSPIELIRTKVQSLPENVRMLDMIRSELQSGGISSLWRGVSPTLWRDVPFSAIYWSAYEFNKKQLAPWAQSEHGSPAIASFVSGASSGTLAALVTHPFDLVKTRRQIKMYEIPVDEPVRATAPLRTEPVPSSVHYDHAHAQSHAHAHAQTGGGTAASSNIASSSATSATRRTVTGAATASANTATATYGVMKTIVAEEGWLGLTNGLGARIGKIAPACAIMITSYEVTKSYFLHSNTDNTIVASKAPTASSRVVAAAVSSSSSSSSPAVAAGAVVASSEAVSS